MLEERGLKERTIVGRIALARRFLGDHVAGQTVDVGGLGVAEVTAFILQETRQRAIPTAKGTASKLRCLLRHLHLVGETGDLAGAVPTVAGWRGCRLPRSPEPGQVERLMGTCDRGTRSGRRAYAMVKLMARLGLRAGEVAALELADIDWASGDLVIRGKGSYLERLPLPQDVGEALSDYLVQHRPRVASRHAFISVRAPLQGLTSGGVQDVVRAACRQAGLSGLSAHRLRYNTAAELLRAGASLAEVGQVLRHRDLGTTALYAKVDRHSLRGMARPWPGAA